MMPGLFHWKHRGCRYVSPVWRESTGDQWIPHTKGQYNDNLLVLPVMSKSAAWQLSGYQWMVPHGTRLLPRIDRYECP